MHFKCFQLSPYKVYLNSNFKNVLMICLRKINYLGAILLSMKRSKK